MSFLLSVRPESLALGLRITAAETTGPARGPRPASSIPATTKKPLLKRLFSICKNGRAIILLSFLLWLLQLELLRLEMFLQPFLLLRLVHQQLEV